MRLLLFILFWQLLRRRWCQTVMARLFLWIHHRRGGGGGGVGAHTAPHITLPNPFMFSHNQTWSTEVIYMYYIHGERIVCPYTPARTFLRDRCTVSNDLSWCNSEREFLLVLPVHLPQELRPTFSVWDRVAVIHRHWQARTASRTLLGQRGKGDDCWQSVFICPQHCTGHFESFSLRCTTTSIITALHGWQKSSAVSLHTARQ